MPRAQNRAAKGSILTEDEILFPSGYTIYLFPGTYCIVYSLYREGGEGCEWWMGRRGGVGGKEGRGLRGGRGGCEMFTM